MANKSFTHLYRLKVTNLSQLNQWHMTMTTRQTRKCRLYVDKSTTVFCVHNHNIDETDKNKKKFHRPALKITRLISNIEKSTGIYPTNYFT